MLRAPIVCLTFLLTLAVTATPAMAVAPSILAVGRQDRHPFVALAAPRAESVVVYIASKPDRGTDGSFFQENVVETGSLTTSEILAGQWLDSLPMDPGSYFVMVRASRDYQGCVSLDPKTYADIIDPGCADGLSVVMPLTIPMPTTSYTVKADVLTAIREVSLTLTGDPLGVKIPYKVCWKQPKGKKKLKQRCAKDSLDGYSWDSNASDSLYISTKGMTRRTKFTWYSLASGEVLVSRRFKIY